MKTNLKYYTHRTDSHRHPKIVMLVKSYNTAIEGLAAEARFWRIINLISESENCILDLTERRNKAYVAQVLEMNLTELNTFIDLLKSEDIALITELDQGKFTAKKVQETLHETMKDRKKGLAKYELKKEKSEFSPEKTEFSPEKTEFSEENLYKRNETKRNLNETKLNKTTTTKENLKSVEAETNQNAFRGGGKESCVSFQPQPYPGTDEDFTRSVENLFREFCDREPNPTSDTKAFIRMVKEPNDYVSEETAWMILHDSFQTAAQNANTKTSYVVGIFKRKMQQLADENKKRQEQANKQVMRQVEQITQLHEESSKEQERAAEVRKLTDFFEQHGNLFTGEQTATIRQAISKNSFFKLQSVILPMMERFNSGEVVEEVKVDDFDDDMPF